MQGTTAGGRKQRDFGRLRGVCATVCMDFAAELVEFGGEHDHVHLLVNYPPKVSGPALSCPGLKTEGCRAPDQRSDHLRGVTHPTAGKPANAIAISSAG